MAAWTSAELDRLGATDQIQITSAQQDGTLRPPRTAWVVRAGDEIYVRAAYRPSTAWYRHAAASGIGHIGFGSDERDVRFTAAGLAMESDADDAYRAKYASRFPSIARSVVGEKTHGRTLRVDPV